MHYHHLVQTLQQMEARWRGNPPPNPSPGRYPSYSRWIRKCHNIQYFACSNQTDGKPLPIVVTVGINYTQGTGTIPDETPHLSSPASRASGLPLVEDRVSSAFEKCCISLFDQQSRIWKQWCLASMNMNALIPHIPDFHLVMINFSPWITTHSWATSIGSADGADLLVSPPHCLGATPQRPFDHLDDFHKKLGKQVILWIGHGLDVVSPHFRLFANKHQIANWLLTANTASGCKPRIQSGGTIKFKR